jgi:hypothetical protein
MWWSTIGVIVSLTCSLLAAPLPVAVQPAHVPRIGVLAMEGGLVATPARFQTEFREEYRKYKATFTVAPSPAPPRTRLSPAPPCMQDVRGVLRDDHSPSYSAGCVSPAAFEPLLNALDVPASVAF